MLTGINSLFWFIAQLPTQIVELRRVRALLDKSGHDTRFFVEREELLTEPGSELLPQGLPAKPPRLARLLDILAPGVFAVASGMLSNRASAKAEISRQKPKAILVGEDGVGGNLPWIAEAAEIGVPVVVVPYEFSGRKQAMDHVSANLADHAVSGVLGRWFARVRPAWVSEHAGQKVFRLPLRYALGYELAGVAPPMPWTVHGGRAAMLLSESPAMSRHYAKEGIPQGKVVETGSIALDDLAEALDGKRNDRDGLRILCALPPNYAASKQEYAELVRFWVAEARKHGDVTVQAHPAARSELASLGYELDGRDITKLIAECDVFTTCVSSVIRLALAAGKPTVNFDCYGFGYDDYNDEPLCSTVSTKDQFSRSLANAAANPSGTTTSEWGRLDGLSSSRILTALTAL